MLKQKKNTNSFVLFLSIVAILISLYAVFFQTKDVNFIQNSEFDSEKGVLDEIRESKILKVGYAGFPPYTIVNLKNNSEEVSGFAIDIVKEIAKRASPPLEIEWHNANWETLKVDMESKKFDFLADAVYQTIPRALDFGLSDPYSYFGIAVALVRIDDNRFTSFEDLDREDIVITLAEGWTSTEYAERYLKKPKFKYVTVGENANLQLDDVLYGRADVALQDVPSVLQYANAHKDKVKALWIKSPPSVVPGGFITRKEDRDLLDFLNYSLEILKADGTISKLDKKWKALGYYNLPELVPSNQLK